MIATEAGRGKQGVCKRYAGDTEKSVRDYHANGVWEMLSKAKKFPLM